MLVEIKPIEFERWHGKKGKDDFSVPKSIEVLFDVSKGCYATGLNEDEEKKYSKMTGLDLSSAGSGVVPHPYWSTPGAKIKLPNHPTILDDTKPLDFIKIKNLKASRFVANSMREYEEGLYPDATHVIFDESEQVDMEASKIELRNKCVLLSANMSADEKANIVQILSNKGVKGRSSNFIEVEIFKIIEDIPKEFVKYAEMDRNEVYTRAAVLEALHRNILTKEGTSVFYMGDRLGFNTEEAIEWFLDPQNQQIKIAILEKLNN